MKSSAHVKLVLLLVLATACSPDTSGSSDSAASEQDTLADDGAPNAPDSSSDVDASPGDDGIGAQDAAAVDSGATVEDAPTADTILEADTPDGIDAGTADTLAPPDTEVGDGAAVDAEAPEADLGDGQPEPDPEPVAPPTEDEFFAALGAASDTGMEEFLARYDMPLCDAESCLLVTTAEGNAVVAKGSFDGWSNGIPLTAAPGFDDIWYGYLPANPNGVTAYKLVVDGQWQVDAENPYIEHGGFGPNSAIYPDGRGRILQWDGIFSPELGNTRTVYVYLPWPYFSDPNAEFPVLYMQDGFNVFTNPAAPFGSWDVEVITDQLVSAGEITAPIIVGIDTKDRMSEYVYAPFSFKGTPMTPKLSQYTTFVADTLDAAVSARFRVLPKPARAMAGSSLGGISSLYIGWNRPDTFRSIASLSGSYWLGDAADGGPEQPAFREVIAADPSPPSPTELRIYLDSGDSAFDGSSTYASDAWIYTDWTRNALIAKGWPNRAEWDTDSNLATPPTNLPLGTAPATVPHLAWSATLPQGAGSWSAYLGTGSALVCLKGAGHTHQEWAWKARFGAVLRYLFPPESP
jgi:predicted alpha/beta superfamily hydrolase